MHPLTTPLFPRREVIRHALLSWMASVVLGPVFTLAGTAFYEMRSGAFEGISPGDLIQILYFWVIVAVVSIVLSSPCFFIFRYVNIQLSTESKTVEKFRSWVIAWAVFLTGLIFLVFALVSEGFKNPVIYLGAIGYALPFVGYYFFFFPPRQQQPIYDGILDQPGDD